MRHNQRTAPVNGSGRQTSELHNLVQRRINSVEAKDQFTCQTILHFNK